MADSKEIEFQPLTTDELRDTGAFLPELNGYTLWHKSPTCDYCQLPLEHSFMVLQKVARSGLSFMCNECLRRLFKEISSSSGVETE